jgi:hypothetical protein
LFRKNKINKNVNSKNPKIAIFSPRSRIKKIKKWREKIIKKTIVFEMLCRTKCFCAKLRNSQCLIILSLFNVFERHKNMKKCLKCENIWRFGTSGSDLVYNNYNIVKSIAQVSKIKIDSFNFAPSPEAYESLVWRCAGRLAFLPFTTLSKPMSCFSKSSELLMH